ncbi:hypothetical protein C2E23DRAFT_811853 [Lenzites betulinus]|nr:hypothetical protein C2E23DRAFT_811853 [Lenzites betulinus]
MYTTRKVTAQSPRHGPRMYHLTANYRSHAGIVDCAAAIVKLITRLWPNSVDVLPPEQGMTAGPKPTFFWDDASANFETFLSDESGNTVEFGAHQCILVRDSTAKQKLRSQVGQVGIVLTIAESKGLEFDDVLLYDPFEDSSEDSQRWRIVLDGIPGHATPAFEHARHSGICRELKFLYVAVTRARMNLWIIDHSQRGVPMRIFWDHAGVIKSHTPGTVMPRLAISSSREEWAEVAQSLFDKKQYGEATLAFERAKMWKEQRVARAYHLRDLVPAASESIIRDFSTSLHSTTNNIQALLTVAEAFEQCAKEAEHAEEKHSYHRIAAQHYAFAGNNKEAARAFHAADRFQDAATYYRMAGMFDEAIDVVQQHRDEVATSVAENIISVSKLQYLRKNEVEKACTLFSSENEALEYMADYGLNTPRAALLEQQGRFSEAARSQLLDGNIYEAVRLLLLDSLNPTSASWAAQVVLDGLWSRATFAFVKESAPPFDTIARSSNCRPPPDELLQLVGNFQGLLASDSMECREMDMFDAIHRDDMDTLRRFRHTLLHPEHEAATFVILDNNFSTPTNLGSLSFVEIASHFKTFLHYARLLQRFVCHPHPCSLPVLRRLFTFTVYDEDHYLVHDGSCLGLGVKHIRTDRARNGWLGLVILRRDLEQRIKRILREHLLKRVLHHNEACHRLLTIRPCFLFAASRSCFRQQCPQYHVDPQEDSSATYNLLVRIHLLQILIYHTLYAAEVPSRELFFQQRVWLRRLYEALYPPHFTLGSVHVLSPDAIPELMEGRSVVTVWIQDFLNNLSPGGRESLHIFLNSLFRATRLAVLWDYHAAFNRLHLIPCAFPGPRSPQLPVWRSKTYVVQDLLLTMQGQVPESLDRGVLLLNHILASRLPIDVVVLCDFMDHLCSSLIIARALRSLGTLHGLTLPKSWIARTLPSFPVLRAKSTDLAAQYTWHLRDLVQQVYSGYDTEWLILVENLDLSKPGANITRNILVARIFKNLCLWGCNQRSDELRHDVMATISAIQEITGSSRYACATSWDGLMRAAGASTTGSDLDEMVQLWDTAMPMPKHVSRSVRRIPFARITDIAAILGVKQLLELVATPPLMTTASRAAYESRPPTITPVLANTRGTNAGDFSESFRQDTGEIGSDSEGAHQNAPGLTPRERAAATLIAATFKDYWTRVRAHRDTFQERRLRIYTQFQAHAQKTEWTTFRCRALFRRALPHAYFAVECMKDHLSTAIARTKEELKSINHRKLEDMQMTMERLTQLLQQVSRFHQDWHPSASAYNRCDEDTIRSRIRSADDFLRTVEIDMGEAFEWREDVDLAMKAAFP